MHSTLDAVQADNDCRVVVLTGAGRGFCAGLILTARTVEADEALRLGMVSRISEEDDTVLQDALGIAETLCEYGQFGLESTKQVLWANLDAGSLESALHLENRSQILAGTGGEMRAFAQEFANRKKD